jgi:hypothetical protein
MRLERINSQSLYTENQPVIRTISFNYLGQDVKTVSDFNASQLYHVTRKNSHPRSQSVINQQTIGGVLLHRSDCGDFSFFEGGERDVIELTVSVDSMDVIHPDVTTNLTNPMLQDPLEFSVTFIYENFGLNGVQHDAKFWWLK